MPEQIQVRITDGGDFYIKCNDPHPRKGDPHVMQLTGHPDRRIRWHCNSHEFSIQFYGANPFNDVQNLVLDSEGRNIISPEVRDHEEPTTYAYEIRNQTLQGQMQGGSDPGLIIEP